ncbi:MAG: hypothetical protein M3N51_00090 [Actinomycetota bacterium]|nr:hypothetical protein [Actinomycetota bacterium]
MIKARATNMAAMATTMAWAVAGSARVTTLKTKPISRNSTEFTRKATTSQNCNRAIREEGDMAKRVP